MMRRRDVITLLGGAAAAWPLAARAQQRTTMPVIGFMHSGISGQYDFVLGGFREGLREAGYVEGRNLAVEYRWGNNQFERLRALATELVRLNVAVIVAGGTAAPALAAKEATSAIPIVAVFGGDPVRVGLITSLNRPEGNVTGISYNSGALFGKAIGHLHDVVPQATTLAILDDSRLPAGNEFAKRFGLEASVLWREIIRLEPRSDRDFEPALAPLAARGTAALYVRPSPLFTGNRAKLLALVDRYKIPAIYPDRVYAFDGGLMSYGASQADIFRQSGAYIGRLLKGDKPAELPFQLPTRHELVINLKAAKALGIEVPATILLRADEVIE